MSINKEIILTFLLLVFTVIFFGLTDIDIEIQDTFFDYTHQQWILDKDLQPYKFIFYDGIKRLLILIGVLFLLTLILFRKNRTIQSYKKGMIIVVLSGILIPVVVGGLKRATNMPCPKNEIHYGGIYPYTKVWECYSKTFKEPCSTRCFPAGHASGGFALFSLFFLFRSRRNKILAIAGALIVGWSMGLYKMLIGDHFLSHTLITMIIAWLIVLIIAKILKL